VSCSCDYDEYAAVYVAKRIIARKQHKCSECSTPILAGEQYERVGSFFDGAWGTYRTCSRCLALRDFVEAHVPCMCWQHHSMRSDVIETAREYAHEGPGLLFGAYRREVLIKRARLLAQSAAKGGA